MQPVESQKIEGMNDFAAAVRELARSLPAASETVAKASRELPAAVARESQLARQAFDGGLLTGGVVGLVIGLVIGLILGLILGRKA